jgi:hypothetical protein
MYARLPAILTFTAGIAIGAFTNIFTGLEREQLAWRVVAMGAFLVSGVLLFASAVRAESALSRARLISQGATDLDKQFRHEFGKKGWVFVVLGAAAGVAAVALLVMATLVRTTRP